MTAVGRSLVSIGESTGPIFSSRLPLPVVHSLPRLATPIGSFLLHMSAGARRPQVTYTYRAGDGSAPRGRGGPCTHSHVVPRPGRLAAENASTRPRPPTGTPHTLVRSVAVERFGERQTLWETLDPCPCLPATMRAKCCTTTSESGVFPGTSDIPISRAITRIMVQTVFIYKNRKGSVALRSETFQRKSAQNPRFQCFCSQNARRTP